MVTVEDRFWNKVEKSDNCWNWTAGKRDGYGRFSLNGKLVNAHRYSYELLVEPINNNMQIDHLCRNRSCVRPDHLEPVTQYENFSRGLGTINATNAAAELKLSKNECKNGHLYTEDNTYFYKNGKRKFRRCRECKKKSDYDQYHRSNRSGDGRIKEVNIR